VPGTDAVARRDMTAAEEAAWWATVRDDLADPIRLGPRDVEPSTLALFVAEVVAEVLARRGHLVELAGYPASVRHRCGTALEYPAWRLLEVAEAYPFTPIPGVLVHVPARTCPGCAQRATALELTPARS
jgi:hypothetical protein